MTRSDPARTSFPRAGGRAHKWSRKGAIVSVAGTLIISCALVFNIFGNQPTAFEKATTLVFSTSLPEFIALANDPGHDQRFVWDSDKCSAPVLGSAGKTYDFSDACRRHDFGYRNFSRIDGGKKWTKALRERVDRRFLSDMNASCAARKKIERGACRTWAELYYTAVRRYGGP